MVGGCELGVTNGHYHIWLCGEILQFYLIIRNVVGYLISSQGYMYAIRCIERTADLQKFRVKNRISLLSDDCIVLNLNEITSDPSENLRVL